MALYLNPRIVVRSVKASVLPKHVKFLKYTSLVVRSRFSVTANPELNMLKRPREGDRIVLQGEADQVPGQEPGDIIFSLVETEHSVFRRVEADLSADLEITLAEALCGFSRVVIKHLDGRGLHMDHTQPAGRTLKPGQVIKILGEGMPHKKSEAKGDLYLVVQVKFPEDGWLQNDSILKLQGLLPKPAQPIKADTVDEVEYDQSASLDNFGAGAQSSGEVWEDEDEHDEGVPQCAQQ